MYFPESFKVQSRNGGGRFLDVDMRRKNESIENWLKEPVQRWYQEYGNQGKLYEKVHLQGENVKPNPGLITTAENEHSEIQITKKPSHIAANFSDHFIVRRKQVEASKPILVPPVPGLNEAPKEVELNLIINNNSSAPRSGTSASGPVHHDGKKGSESFGSGTPSTNSILTPFHLLRPNRSNLNNLKPAFDRVFKQGLSCPGMDTRCTSEVYASHGRNTGGKTTASLSYLRPFSSGISGSEGASEKYRIPVPAHTKGKKNLNKFSPSFSSSSSQRIVEEKVSATLESYHFISPQKSSAFAQTTELGVSDGEEKLGYERSIVDACFESVGSATFDGQKEGGHVTKASSVSEKGDVASRTTVSMASETSLAEINRPGKPKLRPWTESATMNGDNATHASSLKLSPVYSINDAHRPSPVIVNRSVQLRYGKSDLSSPLGNFHHPIRNYLMSSANCDNYGFYRPVEHQLPSIFWTCAQIYPIPIQLVIDHLVSVKKVGEGVYGEVYKAYFRGIPEPRVYKVIPIEGDKSVNGEKQKRFGEIEPEIVIAKELNKLRFGIVGCFTDGHCRLLNARICKGRYPAVLTEQWRTWHKTYVSQNDLPEFDNHQLYAVLEFEFHGTDIETYKFRNAKQSMAVLIHVIYALAAAEAALQFEHRDLHWGNILVLRTRELYTTYSIDGMKYRVANCGLKSTIIDYTISRLTNTETGKPVYTDLSKDEDQFCGSEDYQFEIYRMMRTENKNDWSTFCPKTNVFWMHYLVGKFIEKARYGDTTSGAHYHFKNKLLRIQANILKYNSCLECVHKFVGPFTRDLESE